MPARGIPIQGAPAWIDSDLYTIEAESEGDQSEEMLRGPMMQTLLEERFKLKARREIGEIPIYELTVAIRGGPKAGKLHSRFRAGRTHSSVRRAEI